MLAKKTNSEVSEESKMVFIDLKKAYRKVPTQRGFVEVYYLEKKGVWIAYIRTIEDIY